MYHWKASFAEKYRRRDRGERMPAERRPATTQLQPTLLALLCFLALLYRLQAQRRATLSGAKIGTPLLACAYTSINVAINRQRGSRREENR
jgi:hypothetical protein